MTPTIPMTPTPKQNACKGFPGIRCPLCGTADEVQLLDLDDLQTLRCGGCDESYTVDDIRELAAAWQRVLTWIDSAPTVPD